MIESALTSSPQQFSQRFVKSQHRFILLFDSAEACKQQLLPMRRRVDKMLKEQGQISYVRFERLEPGVVVSLVWFLGHSERNLDSRLALLAAQAVKVHNNDNQHACDDSLPERVDVQQVSSVINGRQDEGAKQRSVNRSDRAKEAGAADHGRSYRLQLPAFSLRCI